MSIKEAKGRNSLILYLSLKKSISPRSVVIASNVRRGSQFVGVLGPVGWIGFFEGPEKKKRLFISISPVWFFIVFQHFSGWWGVFAWGEMLPDYYPSHQSNCTFGPLNFFFLIRAIVIFRDSSSLNCEVKKLEFYDSSLKILIPSFSPLLLPLSALLVT